MYNRYYFKKVSDMTAREIMLLAQKIVGLCSSARVNVKDGWMSVRHVSKYDEEKVRMLEEEGFNSIDEEER